MTKSAKANKAFNILEIASKSKMLNHVSEKDLYNDSKKYGIEVMTTALATFYEWRKLAT